MSRSRPTGRHWEATTYRIQRFRVFASCHSIPFSFPTSIRLRASETDVLRSHQRRRAIFLRWLQSNLFAARQANQKVWLMFHIPPGIDGYATTHKSDVQPNGKSSPVDKSCADSIVPMWVPELDSRVRPSPCELPGCGPGGFRGPHPHGRFQIVNTAGVDQAFVLIDPAISPIFDQNPAFRIVLFRSDGSLADQSTYYLTNLKQASRKVRGRWKKEYTFTQKWRAPRLDTASLGKIYSQIATTEDARDQWLKLYGVSSRAVQVPADSVRGLYCAIGWLDLLEYEKCYCQ